MIRGTPATLRHPCVTRCPRLQEVAAELIRRQPPPEVWACSKCSTLSPVNARKCISCGARPPKLQLGYHPVGKAAVNIAMAISKTQAPKAPRPDVKVEVGAAPAPKTGAPKRSEDASAWALRQATAEGLTLEPTDGAGGYKGVQEKDLRTRPFIARFRGQSLGRFDTAEEAALAYARRVAEANPERGQPKPTSSLPPGWSVEDRSTSVGRYYKVFHSPDGTSSCYSLVKVRLLERGSVHSRSKVGIGRVG